MQISYVIALQISYGIYFMIFLPIPRSYVIFLSFICVVRYHFTNISEEQRPAQRPKLVRARSKTCTGHVLCVCKSSCNLPRATLRGSALDTQLVSTYHPLSTYEKVATPLIRFLAGIRVALLGSHPDEHL